MRSAAEAAAEAVCDAICGDASAAPVLLELAERGGQARELRLVLALLAARGFPALSRTRREAVLRAWRDSRIPQRRAAFKGLKEGALLGHYSRPGSWAAIGYPGPPAEGGSPRGARLPVEAPRGGTLDCDVCVVGSGAGGGTAAAVLAGAGLDVVVLEAGLSYDDEDFDGDELSAYRRLYWAGAAATTDDGGIRLLAGECLGGTTTINYTTSFAPPERLREEWGGPFLGADFARSVDAVLGRIGVNGDHCRPSRREELLERGLRALGWHVAAMPRNVAGCDQDGVCGFCGFGCSLGAKQSTVKTWLADAVAGGARLVVGCAARRVRVRGGRAVGVEADGVTVRARAVVVAGGALQTPALLRRSGLTNASVGRHLHLHPTTAVSAVFDEEVRPWEGTMQARYSDEHADLDAGYGLKYETAAVHPGVLGIFSPWDGREEHEALVRDLPRTFGIGLLLRDRSEGEVRLDRRGGPRVRYRLSGYDAGHVRLGLDGAARILEAAGARRIYSSHARPCAFEPGPGARERWLDDCGRVGLAPGRCVFVAFHPSGSARVGASPATSACDWDGQTWEVAGLYVMDGSTFPSASGVNPMITIEAIAHLSASRLAARLA